MRWEDIDHETRKRLSDVDAELAADDQEVERLRETTLRELIEEENIKGRHYAKIAAEATTSRYRQAYQNSAEMRNSRENALRAFAAENGIEL